MVKAVVGAQWGDEGKGRVIDLFAQTADMVIRYQGGDNAGHTVVNEHGTFKLHIVPSGIFNPNTVCIIGAGCVVNPANLLQELKELEAAGVSTKNLFISNRAHVIMPHHTALDDLLKNRLGTTGRGIGPAYADKANRVGIRMGDLSRPDVLRDRVGAAPQRWSDLGGLETLADNDVIYEQALAWGKRLKDRIVDTLPLTSKAIRDRKSILLEGQLGVMRDLDWGTYPYVTSSNPLAGGACAGAGIPSREIEEVIGVVKCYGTAVGEGPFPGELLGDDGDRLREIGQEYGATTGRPRRCAWLDVVALKYATTLSGFTSLVATKLDVLDYFDEVKICVAYKIDGEITQDMPDPYDLGRAAPVYEVMPGWRTSTAPCRTWTDLPLNARRFLERVETYGETPIRWVSVGPERDEIIPVPHGRV